MAAIESHRSHEILRYTLSVDIFGFLPRQEAIVLFGLVIPLLFSDIDNVIGNPIQHHLEAYSVFDYISVSFRSL